MKRPPYWVLFTRRESRQVDLFPMLYRIGIRKTRPLSVYLYTVDKSQNTTRRHSGTGFYNHRSIYGLFLASQSFCMWRNMQKRLLLNERFIMLILRAAYIFKLCWFYLIPSLAASSSKRQRRGATISIKFG